MLRRAPLLLLLVACRPGAPPVDEDSAGATDSSPGTDPTEFVPPVASRA